MVEKNSSEQLFKRSEYLSFIGVRHKPLRVESPLNLKTIKLRLLLSPNASYTNKAALSWTSTLSADRGFTINSLSANFWSRETQCVLKRSSETEVGFKFIPCDLVSCLHSREKLHQKVYGLFSGERIIVGSQLPPMSFCRHSSTKAMDDVVPLNDKIRFVNDDSSLIGLLEKVHSLLLEENLHESLYEPTWTADYRVRSPWTWKEWFSRCRQTKGRGLLAQPSKPIDKLPSIENLIFPQFLLSKNTVRFASERRSTSV